MMYSDLDLIVACGVTALVSHAVWIVPRWLDRRKARRAQECGIGVRHDGPCAPGGDQT